jgi:hypothetical protein
MNTTPLAHLTDEEFSTHLAMKENPTDEEVEAMIRIDALLDVKHDFEAEFAELMERSKAIKQQSQEVVARSRKQTEMFNGLNS